MIKSTIVHFCRVCPLRRTEIESIEIDREDFSADVKMVNICGHPAADERTTVLDEQIPDWCPLRETSYQITLPLLSDVFDGER
jgi:hypothetical protein